MRLEYYDCKFNYIKKCQIIKFDQVRCRLIVGHTQLVYMLNSIFTIERLPTSLLILNMGSFDAIGSEESASFESFAKMYQKQGVQCLP